MNRIDARFAQLKSASRKALVPFITAGDPSPDGVVALLHALTESGADLIEIGVPFSDPMADGPVIQHASERALAKGVGLAQIFGWIAEFRKTDTTTPIVLMGYLNPVEIHGSERFARDAVGAGVDGVLLVDCPLEESQAVGAIEAAGMRRIFLTAPTTSPARLAAMCEKARGFLYHVAFAGITGANRLSPDAVRERVTAIKARTATPVAVGFGVRDADSAAALAPFADAVVIGSALVETLAAASSTQAACGAARAFLAPIRAALDAGSAAHAA